MAIPRDFSGTEHTGFALDSGMVSIKAMIQVWFFFYKYLFCYLTKFHFRMGSVPVSPRFKKKHCTRMNTIECTSVKQPKAPGGIRAHSSEGPVIQSQQL